MIKKCAFYIVVILLITIALVYYRNYYIFPKVLKRFEPIHNRLVIMLPIILRLFDKYQITYWIAYGTLLGLVRHNHKFIPWDDDIDLDIVYTNDIEDKLEKINTELLNYNLKLSVRPFGYAVDNINQNIQGGKAYIDLFLFYSKDNRYVPNEHVQNTWPYCWYYKDDIFPLENDIFCDIVIKRPNNMINILKRFYGEDCLDSLKLTQIHHGNKFERYLVQSLQFIPLPKSVY